MAEVAQVTAYHNYIGGQWVESVSGRTYPITSPADKDTVLGDFQASVSEDALRAVEAASDALAAWSATPRAPEGGRPLGRDGDNAGSGRTTLPARSPWRRASLSPTRQARSSAR